MDSQINPPSKLKKIYDFVDFEYLIFVSLKQDKSDLSVSIKSFPPLDLLYSVNFKSDSVYQHREYNEDQMEAYLEGFDQKIETGLYRVPDSNGNQSDGEAITFNPLPDGVRQYLVVTANQVIEVLSFGEPSIEPVLFEPNSAPRTRIASVRSELIPE